MIKRPICKKCGNIKVVKNGHNSCRIQRYKCKECKAVFVWKYHKEVMCQPKNIHKNNWDCSRFCVNTV